MPGQNRVQIPLTPPGEEESVPVFLCDVGWRGEYTSLELHPHSTGLVLSVFGQSFLEYFPQDRLKPEWPGEATVQQPIDLLLDGSDVGLHGGQFSFFRDHVSPFRKKCGTAPARESHAYIIAQIISKSNNQTIWRRFCGVLRLWF